MTTAVSNWISVSYPHPRSHQRLADPVWRQVNQKCNVFLEHSRNASLNCERKAINLLFENVPEKSVVHNMWAITGSIDLFWCIIFKISVMKNIWKENERWRGAAFFKSVLTKGIGYFTSISLKIRPHLCKDICKDQICKYSSRWQ